MKKKNGHAYLRTDVVQTIQTNTAPRCFYCGALYIKDLQFCKDNFSVWMPACVCINKPTIRIATGGEVVFDGV